MLHHFKKISDGTSDNAKLVSLQIRLPALWNNGVKDVLGLFIHKALIGLKWWEFVKPVINFVPPGGKLTDLSGI
jgi:hypothetical protein